MTGSRAAMLPIRSFVFLLAVTLATAAVAYDPPPGAGGFQWRALGTPVRSAHQMVWDSRRGRILMLGGTTYTGFQGSEIWEFARTPNPHWHPFPVGGESPLPRSDFAAVYDSVFDRILLFGGQDGPFGDAFADLWELRLAASPLWHRLATAPGPAPSCRYGASMVLTNDERLVVFGGAACALADSDVWVMRLGTEPLRWEDHPFSGPQPGRRFYHSAAYSRLMNSMVVFGGQHFVPDNYLDQFPPVPQATWELSLAEPMHWTLGPSSPLESVPVAESAAPIAAEPRGRFAWLLPGDQDFATYDQSVWRYDFVAHSWLRVSGNDGFTGLFASAAACYDRVADGVLVQGGGDYALVASPASASARTLWFHAVEPTGWETAIATGPRAYRSYPVANIDPWHHRLLSFDADGLWTWDLLGEGPWILDRAVVGPTAQSMMTVVDTRRRRLLAFGGARPERSTINRLAPADSLWSLDLDGPARWQAVPISASAGRAVFGNGAVYDPAADRVIVFSDMDGASQGSGVLYAQRDTVLCIDLSDGTPHWVQQPTQGEAPPPLTASAPLFDPENHALYLFGGGRSALDGWNSSVVSRLDLRNRSWSVAASPWVFGMARAGVAFDPTFDRIVVAGAAGLGVFANSSTDIFTSPRDTLAWTLQSVAGGNVPATSGPLWFDSSADRLLKWSDGVLFELTWPIPTPPPYGAGDIRAGADDVSIRWNGQRVSDYTVRIERSVDGAQTWTRLAVVHPQLDGSVMYSDTNPSTTPVAYRATIERKGQIVVLGTAALRNGIPTSSRFQLTGLRPNPTAGRASIELATPADAEVTIEVFDLAGRKVAGTQRRPLAAGRAAFDLALPRDLAPGLYLVRASDGRTRVQSRLAVVR